HRVPGGEQRPGGRTRAGVPQPRDALAPHRPLLPGRAGVAVLHGDAAHAVPALRGGAVRVRVPGQRHRSLRRGAERDGLQPLRLHPVLPEQLPVQGAPLQLLPLHQRVGPAGADGDEPGRDGARPRRDGEVHVLRAAHRARAHLHAPGRPADQGRGPEDRLPAGVPHHGHRLRQPQRPRVHRLQAAGATAPVRRAPRAGHAPAHRLPDADQEPQSGACMSAAPELAPATAVDLEGAPLIIGEHTSESLNKSLLNHVWRKAGPGWWALFLPALAGSGLLLTCIVYLEWRGVGVWGNNQPVGWAFDIINFVWWIGIGHAGTLISAILLLLQQKWRTSINRFAEAMTLFAVLCAALYPTLHTGRPWFDYWLLP